MLGISLNGMGNILSGFSTNNVAGLFVAYGVVFGAGIS